MNRNLFYQTKDAMPKTCICAYNQTTSECVELWASLSKKEQDRLKGEMGLCAYAMKRPHQVIEAPVGGVNLAVC